MTDEWSYQCNPAQIWVQHLICKAKQMVFFILPWNEKIFFLETLDESSRHNQCLPPSIHDIYITVKFKASTKERVPKLKSAKVWYGGVGVTQNQILNHIWENIKTLNIASSSHDLWRNWSLSLFSLLNSYKVLICTIVLTRHVD